MTFLGARLSSGGVLCCVLILAVVILNAAPAPAQSARPNVVVIVADDMRPDGLPVMKSLGQLAQRGVTFSNAVVTTPVCCPSRATILSGLYAGHHGVHSNVAPFGGIERFDDRSTLATWLQGAGIRTGLVGRYLNGYHAEIIPPGWSYWFGIWTFGEDNSLYHRYYVTNNSGKDEFYGSSSEDLSTRVIGRKALSFLRADQSQPFMLMLTPRAPHPPATPDVHDQGLYDDLEVSFPPSYDEADVSDKPAWIQALPPLPVADRERIVKIRRRQLETLVGLDRAIDALVEQLRADGRLDNTWFIFIADNGLLFGEHRLPIGKGCVYEECIRVPMIVVPPPGFGVAARTDDHLVANIDLAPTVAAIFGVEPGAPVDGRSLLPLLTDPAAPWRDALLLEMWDEGGDHGFQAVRTPSQVFARLSSGEQELYDLAADPYELDNQADNPAFAGLVTQLSARLEALAAAGPR